MPEKKVIVLETSKGRIEFELFEDKAPGTTSNFLELTEKGFYDGLSFHRYVAGFVIQGGDPQGTGMGGSDKQIKLEVHPDLKHTNGSVAMARSQDLDSASSQFYITLAPQPMLDGQYAVFGQVITGMDVVSQLREGDTMDSVKVKS